MAVLEGKAYWASVTTPNTTYDPVYTVDLVVDDEVANDFEARGFRIKDLSIKDEQGTPTNVGRALTIKRKVNGPNGMVRNAPKLFDKEKNLIGIATLANPVQKKEVDNYTFKLKLDM